MAAETTDLKSILSQAEWHGGEQKAAMKESLAQKWQRLKDAREKVTSALGRGTNLAIGVSNPDTMAALAQYAGEKKTEAWNNTKDKLAEVRDAIGHGKDSLVASALGKLGDLKAEIGKRVISPTVEGAKNVSRTIDKGVVRGELLGYFAVARAGMAVEAGVEKGKTTAEAAIARGREWNGRMQEYFRTQNELLKLGVQQGMADLAGAYFDSPRFAAENTRKGGEFVARNARRGGEAVGNVISRRVESSTNKAQEHRQRATELRAARQQLRAPRPTA